MWLRVILPHPVHRKQPESAMRRMFPAGPPFARENSPGIGSSPLGLPRRSGPVSMVRFAAQCMLKTSPTSSACARDDQENHLVENPRIAGIRKESYEARPRHKIEVHIPERK
jgi:hypothetical protein